MIKKAILYLGVFWAIVIAGEASAANDASRETDKEASAAEKIHHLSLFSFVQHYGPRGRQSRPVLVTLRIKGRSGAERFCLDQLRLRDAVHDVLSFGRGLRTEQRKASRFENRLYKAALRIIPKGELAGVRMRTSDYPADFTDDMNLTRETCTALRE